MCSSMCTISIFWIWGKVEDIVGSEKHHFTEKAGWKRKIKTNAIFHFKSVIYTPKTVPLQQ